MSKSTFALIALTVAVLPIDRSRLVIAAEPGAMSAHSNLSFERDIRPILKANCFHCHGAEGVAKGNLDLRLKRFAMKGGDQGPVIEPGKRHESLLFERISKGEMPPGGKRLSPEVIETIGKWIDAGAINLRDEPETVEAIEYITPEDREFWSFQPITSVEVPAVSPAAAVDGNAGVLSEIDAFLLQELQSRGLSFSSPADKVTLVKRVYFDLTGLPPTPQELAEAVDDSAEAWYEKLVDKLLASHHYGEHWARNWLDTAGYAESDGFSPEDFVRPYAYKYRDYVIRSLNANKPFDRFLMEQLAGDELLQPHPGDYSPEDVELLTATGFLRMGADGTNSGAVDQDLARNQVIADTVKIVSTSLLGLSVGCCQCHDHRYDPIPQTDYYRLRAVFEPAYDWKNWRAPNSRRVSLMTSADRQRSSEVDAEIAVVQKEKNAKQTEFLNTAFDKELEKHPAEKRDALRAAFKSNAEMRSEEQKKLVADNPSLNITPGVLYQYNAQAAEELKKFDQRIGEIQTKKPIEDFVAALTEIPGQVPTTFLFHRGDHRQPTISITPGGLTILAPPGRQLEIPSTNPELKSTGRRLAFARWIVGNDNPLTARVLVNRVWMGHFGLGIVNTPNDFGTLGELPTHPKLLDWLANDFRSHGWNLKRLHRQIVLSAAYRQSSTLDETRMDRDPAGTWLSHFPLRRLTAEQLRDRMLMVSGVLNSTPYGNSIPVKEDEVGQVVVGAMATPPGLPLPAASDAFRRSIYIQNRRTMPLAFLQSFDQPVMETNCDRRINSTVPTQALMLMNSEFVLNQSLHFAYRLRRECGNDTSAQIRKAWQLAYLRTPQDDELQDAVRFIESRTESLTSKSPADPDASLKPFVSLCQVLLSSNEFLYSD